MGVRDAIVLNTTGSNFEAIQADDTVRIKGDNTELLSIRNSSGDTILSVDTVNASVNLTGNVTGSADISGSANTTASFGRFDGTTFAGDGSDLSVRNTLPRFTGFLTGSAQIASEISGAFTSGFEYDGTIIGTNQCGGPGAWSIGASIGFNLHTSHVATGNSPNAILSVYGTGADEFEGVSWSEITSAPNPTSYGMATGPYDAAIIVGGNRSGSISWNGSSWQAEASTNRAMTVLAAGAGTTEATLVFGGLSGSAGAPAYNDSTLASSQTEAYDGSSWSECNDMLIPRFRGFQTGIGTQNSSISFGGCGRLNLTVNPPSPYSAITFNDPRSQGDHLEEWDGSTWTYRGEYYAHPGTSYFIHSGGGAGTANASSFYGGYTRALGGSGYNASHYHWDGTAFSDGTGMILRKQANKGAGQGGAGGAHTTIGGTAYDPSPYAYNNTGYIEDYEPTATMISTGSFGRIIATSLAGDATNISSSLFEGTNAISGSSKIASEISGAFDEGFEFTGAISGSILSSGSFGRIEASFFEGNANFISSSISVGDNIISSSAQIAQDISGSFDEGFEFTGTIDGEVITAGGVWSTGGDLIIPKHSGAMTGTQNAGLYVAGALSSGYGWYGSGNRTYTEEYNGTNWSAGTDFPLDSEGTNLMPLAPAGPDPANKAGTGAQNAALVFGGQSHYSTPRSTGSAFTYDGTAYTQVAFMPEPMSCHIGAGTQNATISYGGYERGMSSPYPASVSEYSHTFDGSSWSNISNMIYDRRGLASTPNGTINSTMAFGATANSPDIKSTECWNGSSWTECPEQNVRRVCMGGAGSPNDAQVFGGQGSYGSNSPLTNGTSEYWNGITWNTGATMVRAGGAAGDGNAVRGAGSAASALAAGGYPGAGAYTGTEEYHGPAISTGSFGRVVSSTISGDATNISSSIFESTNVVTSSIQLATDISGSFDEGFEFGLTALQKTSASFVGVSGSAFAYANHSATTMSISSTCGSDFDYRIADNLSRIKGTQAFGYGVWSNAAAMISATHGRAMAGTQNAFLSIGGYSAPTQTTTEKFNGSSWSVSAALISSAKASAGVGTQNAAGMFGGYDDYDQSEFYNGAAWSNGPNMGTSAAYRGSAGTQNAGLIYGGNGPGNAKKTETELYNGHVYSETADLSTARGLASAGGTQNDAIYAGGLGASPSPLKTDTEIWNGTSWTEVANLNTGRWASTGIGTANHHVVVTGHAGGDICNNTEEWNGSSWSETSDLISLRAYAGNAAGGLGCQGIYAGGYSSPGNAIVGTTELWDASSLINTGSFGRLIANNITGDATPFSSSLYSSTNVVTSSFQIASEVSGAFTSGFEFSGTISGSSTSTGSFGRLEAQFLTGDGSNIAAQIFSGENIISSSAQIASEISGAFDEGFEFTGTIGTADAAWSTTGNIISARNGAKMADASANAAVMFGGRLGTNPAGQCGFTCTEEYNGSSWSLGGSMIIERMHHYGFGTQTAAVATMGVSGSAVASGFYNSANTTGNRSALSKTEHYDGSSWSEATDIINSTRGAHGFANGTQNAGVVSNGCISAPNAGPGFDECTFTYNGTNWTQVACSPIRQYMGGSAGDASGMVMGGSGLPHAQPGHSGGPYAYADNRAQRYNCASDSWDTLPGLSVTHTGAAGFGTTNNTYIAGGQSQPTTPWNVGYHGNVLENFDGTSWSTCTNIPVGIRFGSAAGLGSGILTGGCQGPVHPGSSDATAVGSYSWNEFESTGSFGRVEADELHGDFSNMRGSVFSHLNAVSGAAQIASDISGSFNKGFTHSGLISGSVGTTGSFGRIDNTHRPEQIFYTGDGKNLNVPISGFLSSSRQIDEAGSVDGAFVTGSFSGGFEVSSGSLGRGLVSGSATSTASFELLTPKGDTDVHELTFSGSKDRHAFQLPVFTDVDLNYQAYEAEYSTGSLSGSVERVADVVVGQEAGEFYFHSDKNALAYTYASSSMISQSLTLGTIINRTGSSEGSVTQSIGFFTQSFYSSTIVTCYITGSQVY